MTPCATRLTQTCCSALGAAQCACRRERRLTDLSRSTWPVREPVTQEGPHRWQGSTSLSATQGPTTVAALLGQVTGSDAEVECRRRRPLRSASCLATRAGPGTGLMGAEHAVLMATVRPLLLIAVFLPLSVHRYRNLNRSAPSPRSSTTRYLAWSDSPPSSSRDRGRGSTYGIRLLCHPTCARPAISLAPDTRPRAPGWAA